MRSNFLLSTNYSDGVIQKRWQDSMTYISLNQKDKIMLGKRVENFIECHDRDPWDADQCVANDQSLKYS